ncbi:MAG: hypothetical protein RL660_1490 [Bacteroidota bacterium]|jgi:hypothetical protein
MISTTQTRSSYAAEQFVSHLSTFFASYVEQAK